MEFLTYKAELIDKRVIRIDEAYTSKECCAFIRKHGGVVHKKSSLV
ncbi:MULTISPECIES: zinc ribbon domain-containing protein [unclassified Methanosarcina]